MKKKSNKVIKECRNFIQNGKLSKWYFYIILPLIPFILFILSIVFIIYKLIKKGA